MRRQNAGVLLGMLIFWGLVAGVPAQKRVVHDGNSSGRLKKLLPTIYVELDVARLPGKGQSEAKDDLVWLRLYNNSRWGIRLESSGGLSEKARDSTLYYDILSRRDTISESHMCHVCSINILRPGRNLLFGVPRESLVGAYALRINFSYEWEDDLDVAAGIEPTHYVFLYVKKLALK